MMQVLFIQKHQSPHFHGFLFVGGWVDLGNEFDMKKILLFSYLFINMVWAQGWVQTFGGGEGEELF
jgi:hypothetical protein